MAVLEKLPEKAIISAYKGIVDFYLWKGIPVARKWPHWPKRDATPIELLNQQDFAYVNRIFTQLPEFIKQQYRTMAVGTPFTAKDLFVRSYMKGILY